MRFRSIPFVLIAAAAVIPACHNTDAVDSSAFNSTINDYYASRQECLWSGPVKFPAQADASKEDQTAQFDALTDAGLLQRTPAEKQRFLIGSKRVNNYDLSDKGRSNWTADPAQPGYGNLCLGNPRVQSIDSYSPDTPNATQYSVNYRYSLSLPGWANTPEIKTAFPRAARDSEGQEATATLTKSQNGWQVQNVNTSNPTSE